MSEENIQFLLDIVGGVESDAKYAKMALAETGNDMNNASNWLLENLKRLQAEDKKKQESGAGEEEEEEEESAEAIAASAQSLRCTDCGKLFSNAERAQFHAVKSGHTNFDESTEATPELTKEEKLAKLAELRAKAAAKKAAQAEQDAIEHKKNEAIRRKKGAESERLKEELKAKQAKIEAEKMKKEKADDLAAKKRIEETIRRTQEERRAKAAAAKAAREGRVVEEAPKPAVPAKENIKSGDYKETRLQLRIPDQPPLIKAFDVDTTLLEVAQAVESERGFAVNGFTMTFPRKTLGRTDFGMTLKEAKLVPSAALILN